MTSGAPIAPAASRASSTEPGSRPMPGPSTPAAARSKTPSTAFSDAGARQPSPPGQPTDITSGWPCSKIASRSAGTATVAYPAPARIAACEDIRTAPVSPREPPAIATWPEVNLVDRAPRFGASPSTAGSMTPPAGSLGAPSGIPIGAIRSSPVRHLPGAMR